MRIAVLAWFKQEPFTIQSRGFLFLTQFIMYLLKHFTLKPSHGDDTPYAAVLLSAIAPRHDAHKKQKRMKIHLSGNVDDTTESNRTYGVACGENNAIEGHTLRASHNLFNVSLHWSDNLEDVTCMNCLKIMKE